MKNCIILSFLATILFAACNNVPTPPAPPSELPVVPQSSSIEDHPGFIHAVYFWLKKDNPELLEEFIQKGLPKLAEVPSIKHVHWGPPADTPRDVVDNSYDVAWIVTFDNAAAQDAYQIDPVHVEFVKLYESLFERVQVYDSVVEHSR